MGGAPLSRRMLRNDAEAPLCGIANLEDCTLKRDVFESEAYPLRDRTLKNTDPTQHQPQMP